MRKQVTLILAGVLGLMVLPWLNGRALAVDGVITINQARALAGNTTPGDTPGFPVTISRAGSYRLVGNLDVTSEANAEHTTAIIITADNVTVDLNGYAIKGPTVCSDLPVTGCSPTGTGDGIFSDRRNITITNGTVHGMGRHGILLGGGGGPIQARIENVHVSSNGLEGITTGEGIGCILISNTAAGNGRHGFGGGTGSTMMGNTATGNGGRGIATGPSTPTGLNMGCSLSSNTVTGNAAEGITAARGCTLTANSVVSNGSTGIGAGDGSTLSSNTVANNGGDGISIGPVITGPGTGCSVNGNTVTNNTGLGLRLNSGCGYAGNAVNGNNGGDANPQVSGGIQMGTNVCRGTTTCP